MTLGLAGQSCRTGQSQENSTTGKYRRGNSSDQNSTSPTQLENGVRLSNDVRFGAMRAPPEPLKVRHLIPCTLCLCSRYR
ncbi:hypothetical protein OUZ56_001508 [Daphnia magna]|uniref:Uncharacterized protein n=1 Tax=Daphnia magna TaxID=35525 RepID=A0ABR0A2W2_9CRUS|nr:hypothetical protein OUZ56_001508 [Daphnia magna]